MDIDLKYKNVKTLSREEMAACVVSLKGELADVQLSGASQSEKDNSHARKIRRSIARLLTALNVEAAI